MEQKSKEIGANEISRSPEFKRRCNISVTSNKPEGCSSVAPSGKELMSKDKALLQSSMLEDVKKLSSNQNMDFCKISTQVSERHNVPLVIIPSKTLPSSSTIATQTMEGPTIIMPSNISIGDNVSSNFNKVFLGQYLQTIGKCVINENPRVYNNTLTTQNEMIQRYWSGGAYATLMYGNSLRNQLLHSLVRKQLQLPYYGINLREWIGSKCFNASTNDRLHLFRKIVEIVDNEHSKGLALMELRPSSFVIFKTGDVKYYGSLMQTGFTRKRGLDSQFSPVHHNFSEKVQKVDADKLVNSETSFISKYIKGKTTNQCSSDNIDMSRSSICYTQHIPSTSTGNTWLTPDNAQLERMWYTFPKEVLLKDGLSLNIYSLGVLLFELLCQFDSIEAHCVAMHGVHHRILPPSFLSRNPKEAGFCLWLLHPESSYRPTTREILQSELIPGFDSTNLSNDEATCGKMEDDESELLLYFLVSLKQHMQNRAASVLKSLEVLDVDLKVIEDKKSCGKSNDGRCPESSRMNVLRSKVLGNIKELENSYYSMRSNSLLPEMHRPDKDVLTKRERLSWVGKDPQNLPTTKEDNIHVDRVGTFFDGVCKFACYDKFEVCGTSKNSEILHINNVICSLSFDRDEQYIAAAGVSKKIKIFEFDSLLDEFVDVQYPILEMSNKSKFTCISWNNYIKNYLASTDYDGLVQLWDASIGQGVSVYSEHQKKTWSVDFSRADPTKFASGGDDCSLKVWNIKEKKSVCTIWNPSNICCVQFSSYSSHLIAFGSADNKIYGYDLRHTKIPWCTLTGHASAVSYVRFLDSDTIVSASIDNTLKLWDLKKTSLDGSSPNACSLTYRGHTNEKNFVGLAVLDGYIACGSETNEVYAYYKSLPMPIASHKFGYFDPLTGVENKNEGHFVSSVCWRKKSQMLAAANSNGIIKILRMV